MRLILASPIVAAIAVTSFDAQAATHCPLGQIYRVSMKACQSRGAAAKFFSGARRASVKEQAAPRQRVTSIARSIRFNQQPAGPPERPAALQEQNASPQQSAYSPSDDARPATPAAKPAAPERDQARAPAPAEQPVVWPYGALR